MWKFRICGGRCEVALQPYYILCEGPWGRVRISPKSILRLPAKCWKQSTPCFILWKPLSVPRGYWLPIDISWTMVVLTDGLNVSIRKFHLLNVTECCDLKMFVWVFDCSFLLVRFRCFNSVQVVTNFSLEWYWKKRGFDSIIFFPDVWNENIY